MDYPGNSLASLDTYSIAENVRDYLNDLNSSTMLIRSQNLVGGLEHFLFSHILGIIIPID